MRRQSTTWIPLAAGALLVAWAVTGCASSILGEDPSTGISVLVSRGPIQPVVREGEVNDEPVPDAAVRVRQLGGGGSLEARTGGDGMAALRVLPGTYRVDVTECPGALALPEAQTVEVRPGAVADVLLSCDTGIR